MISIFCVLEHFSLVASGAEQCTNTTALLRKVFAHYDKHKQPGTNRNEVSPQSFQVGHCVAACV